MKAFVFEKETQYKDGIHIMYPYIVCDTATQHLIRDHVLNYRQVIFSPLSCKNDYDSIIDKCAINVDGWFMYGCTKY